MQSEAKYGTWMIGDRVTVFTYLRWLIDSNDLAQVASINFSRLDLSSSLQNISKNVFGLSLGALEIVLLIFLEILSSS